MVKNRKPVFVSESAHAVIKQLAEDQNCYMGDVVDVLAGIREDFPPKPWPNVKEDQAEELATNETNHDRGPVDGEPIPQEQGGDSQSGEEVVGGTVGADRGPEGVIEGARAEG